MLLSNKVRTTATHLHHHHHWTRLRNAHCRRYRTSSALRTKDPQPQRHILSLSNVSKPKLKLSCSTLINTLSAQSSKPDTRPSSSHYVSSSLTRAALPPSPPMSSDASFEGYNSPSTKSVSQLPSTSNYYFETTPPLGHIEADARHMAAAAAVPRVPVQASAYQPQFAAAAAYMAQPTMASYYPPMQPTPPPQHQMPGLYYQRPLPQVCCHNLEII